MGFLTKLSNLDEIFKDILEVHSGNGYICRDMAGKLVMTA